MNTKEVQIVHFRITFSLLSKRVLVSTFSMKIRFHSHVNYTYFHMNDSAPGLALMERLQATRKWTIRSHLYSIYEKLVDSSLEKFSLMST